MENKIIACKLTDRVCSSKADKIHTLFKTDPKSSNKIVIRKNNETLYYENEMNSQLMKLTSSNRPLVQKSIRPNTDIKIPSSRSKGMSMPSEMSSIERQEKENKWLKLKKRITLSVKNHDADSSFLHNFKHINHVGCDPSNNIRVTSNEKHLEDSRTVGSDSNIGNKTIHRTGASIQTNQNAKENSLKDRVTILEENSSSEDESEYHNVSKFFRSEECLSSISPESSEKTIVFDKTNESVNIEACEIPPSQAYCNVTRTPCHREDSPISVGKSGHNWTNTLLQLQKSIDSISGPRLKQSDEDCLQIIPEMDTSISEK